jgi:uncharacterized protein with HEPN domain
MEVEIKTWLYDILNAINEIDGFFEEVPKEFIAYKNDTRTRRAVERNLEIIGRPQIGYFRRMSQLNYPMRDKLFLPAIE